jgi:hypothetical protein
VLSAQTNYTFLCIALHERHELHKNLEKHAAPITSLVYDKQHTYLKATTEQVTDFVINIDLSMDKQGT